MMSNAVVVLESCHICSLPNVASINKDLIIETADKSIVELEELNDDMQANIIEMKASIRQAKFKLKVEGKYSDIDWYRRIQYALQKKTACRQRLVQLISERKRAERKENSISFERKFMRMAKEILESDMYQAIIEGINVDSR